MTDIYALGSCRLRAPLLYLHRVGAINFSNAQASWYAHNSAECLQRIAMTDGGLSPPDTLLPLILNRDSCPTSWDEGVSPIPSGALGMFEIATRMQWQRGPFVLHSTCLRREGVRDTSQHLMSWEALEADIAALAARFTHVILVGNIALRPGLAEVDQGRAALNQYLEQTAAAHPQLSYVSPNAHISASDPGRDLTDHNHFTPAFQRRMADVYLHAIQAAHPVPFMPQAAPKAGTGVNAILSQ